MLVTAKPYVPLTLITATGTPQIASATDNFHTGVNNSVALTVGTWAVNYASFFGRTSGNNPAYSFCGNGMYGANGANNNTTPTLLTATSNLTLNNVVPSIAGLMAGTNVTPTFLGGINVVVGPEVIVTVTATVTIYCVTFSNQTTSGDTAISSFVTARKLY